MYTLTLTHSERKAFDWIGYRYATGDDFARVLRRSEWGEDGVEWDDAGDITFSIPEHIAWELNRLAESEDYAFPCFAPELVDKLSDFLNAIV